MNIMDVTLGIGGFIGSVITSLVVSDLYDRLPKLAGRLVGRAAKQLPEHLRQRYEEEWLAHLDEIDGKLAKLMHAFGVWLRAPHVAEATERGGKVEGPKMRLDMDRMNAGTALMCLALAAEAGMKVWYGAPALDCALNIAPLLPGVWGLIHGLHLRRKEGRYVEI